MKFVPPISFCSSGNLQGRFHADHWADLKKSGLTDASILRAQVYSLRPSDIRLFDKKEAVTALCFPYSLEFARVKLFGNGAAKYKQLPDSGCRLYMPWGIRPGRVSLVEGEKKTMAACQAGLNAVGIGGLWNWANKDGTPIEEFALLSGRQVEIVPDSDVWQISTLRSAVYALGHELVRAFGCEVEIVKLVNSGGRKIGLDDFLLSQGDVSTLEKVPLWSDFWKREKRAYPGRRLANNQKILAKASKQYTKESAAKRIREIVKQGQTVEQGAMDFNFLMAILRRHPNAEQKTGCGVKRFIPKPIHFGVNGLALERMDGSETDWSWLQALGGKTNRGVVLSALRAAIMEQVIEFKTKAFENDAILFCPVLGLPLDWRMADVDHEPPLTFQVLVEQFSQETGKPLDSIELNPSTDGQVGRVLKDKSLESAWIDFHRHGAKLRILSRKANQKKKA